VQSPDVTETIKDAITVTLGKHARICLGVWLPKTVFSPRHKESLRVVMATLRAR
jgi:hypothetical protein